ncbi:hypothetical protein PMAYCL1PPCAC_15827, partial [Pristionchus mayeri]
FQLNKSFAAKSLMLIYPIPLLLAIRFIVWTPNLVKAQGLYGPVYISTTVGQGVAWDIVKYLMIAYYLLTTLTQFILNAASLRHYANKKKVIEAFKRSKGKRTTEVGLYATTLCNCLVAVVFTALQVLIQFFPGSPLTGFARSGTTIIVDVMALMHIYLLLAFSPALRHYLF